MSWRVAFREIFPINAAYRLPEMALPRPKTCKFEAVFLWLFTILPEFCCTFCPNSWLPKKLGELCHLPPPHTIHRHIGTGVSNVRVYTAPHIMMCGAVYTLTLETPVPICLCIVCGGGRWHSSPNFFGNQEFGQNVQQNSGKIVNNQRKTASNLQVFGLGSAISGNL